MWCYFGVMSSIHLRLPDYLHIRLKERAEEDRRSLNAEIVWLLEQALVESEVHQ